jgi:hypothetical protein
VRPQCIILALRIYSSTVKKNMELTRQKQWVLTQMVYQEVLEELDGHFRGCRIPYMPIKGAYLICSGLSAKMPVRQMQDIDILVNEQDMRKASDYFQQLSTVIMKCYYTDNYRPTETSFMYPVGDSYVLVEVHSRLNFAERFVLPAAMLFARSHDGDEIKRLPSPEDALLIHLCHLQSHIPFEFRPETMVEINLLVSQEGFDWKVFWKHSSATGIEPFIYFILKLYHKIYPVRILPSKKHFYADIMAYLFTEPRYNHAPEWVRRIFLDLPFVRKPMWLIWHKLTHGKRARELYAAKHNQPESAV